MSDITYLRTAEGWRYLCAIRDGHSRRVLGWAMDSVKSSHLVERALRMAHTLRGEVPDGLIFHADRGTQFTSERLWQVCQELGLLWRPCLVPLCLVRKCLFTWSVVVLVGCPSVSGMPETLPLGMTRGFSPLTHH
ncbi:MAG TPA: DDE-type integrase/transposase/recombinase [Corynebacterium glutamicum]|nr:DDE-type integrase/transposase/recombinase [Corynebacterium glutamicum]